MNIDGANTLACTKSINDIADDVRVYPLPHLEALGVIGPEGVFGGLLHHWHLFYSNTVGTTTIKGGTESGGRRRWRPQKLLTQSDSASRARERDPVRTHYK